MMFHHRDHFTIEGDSVSSTWQILRYSTCYLLYWCCLYSWAYIFPNKRPTFMLNVISYGAKLAGVPKIGLFLTVNRFMAQHCKRAPSKFSKLAFKLLSGPLWCLSGPWSSQTRGKQTPRQIFLISQPAISLVFTF